MSGGCSRCASYGSLEQRQAHARFIADAIAAATFSGRYMDTPESIVMSEHHDDREGLDRFRLAQMLQEALFAHPQAGPIPVSASLLTLVMEELRTRSESAPIPDGNKMMPVTTAAVHDTLIDAERYRWLRDHCSQEDRVVVAELADKPYLLDHFVDKGRCGL